MAELRNPTVLRRLRYGNVERVLRVLRRRGPSSRAEVTAATGLSRTALSGIIAELPADGVLIEEAAPAAPAATLGAYRDPTANCTPARAGLLAGAAPFRYKPAVGPESRSELYDLRTDPDEVRSEPMRRPYHLLRERGDDFFHWMTPMYDVPTHVPTDHGTAPSPFEAGRSGR